MFKSFSSSFFKLSKTFVGRLSKQYFQNVFLNQLRQEFLNPLQRNTILMMYEKEKRAIQSTLDYVEKNKIHEKQYVMEPFKDGKTTAHLRKTLESIDPQLSKNGLFLEFGVYKATSTNLIAKAFPNATVYGFDGFEGLPVDWYNYDKTTWRDPEKRLPKVEKNVELVIGWFDDTLPSFVKKHSKKKIAFLNVDCDVYSSTKTIFEHLAPFITEGTVIRFDEYFGYHGYEFHEMKAFHEFVKKHKIQYEYLNYSFMATTVKITSKEK